MLQVKEDVIQKYTAVIGLEVHAQLMTRTKIFSSDSNSFGENPNTNISVVTLGHPGTLPVLNKKVIELAVKMGLACKSDISRVNIFDRKNYFYPDLPKGYQITQDKTPICKGGFVKITRKDGSEQQVRLTKIHLEEDAGKSIHLAEEKDTMVDLNRAGVPLIEIVTEPELKSGEDAALLLNEIRKIVRYLDICDGNMEEGSLRCDANISVMPAGSTVLGQKVEVKNMNSMRNVQKAVEYEIKRQINILEKGGGVLSETRTFDTIKGTTSGMRTKETLTDYRYFPEPDLSPVIISETWLARIQEGMPSLPSELYQKFVNEYNVPENNAAVLIDNRDEAYYFEALGKACGNYRAASNWMVGAIKSYLNEKNIKIGEFPLTPVQLGGLLKMIDHGKVSHTIAVQQILPEMLQKPDQTAEYFARSLNLSTQNDEDALKVLIREVLNSFPEKVNQYRKGKKGLIGMFMGEVMKKSKGKADPKLTNKLLRDTLG